MLYDRLVRRLLFLYIGCMRLVGYASVFLELGLGKYHQKIDLSPLYMLCHEPLYYYYSLSSGDSDIMKQVVKFFQLFNDTLVFKLLSLSRLRR